MGWQAVDDVPAELVVSHAGTRKKFKGLKEYEAYDVGPVCPLNCVDEYVVIVTLSSKPLSAVSSILTGCTSG